MSRQQMTDEREQEEAMSDIKDLSAAMAKAFAQIEGAVKGKTNPAFRSRYADLAAVVDAIRPALAEHGLWFTQPTSRVDGGVCVETLLFHASGQSLSLGTLFMPATKQDAQGYGSALTYARRYSLMAAFAVPAEDDDGNAAVARVQAHAEPAVPSDRVAAILRDANACADRGGLTTLWMKLTDVEQDAVRDEFNAVKRKLPAAVPA
jgi:hypothetical protein